MREYMLRERQDLRDLLILIGRQEFSAHVGVHKYLSLA